MRKSLLSLSALLVLAAGVRAAEPDRYLPADTEQVAVLNLKQLTGSKLFDKYLKAEMKKVLEDNAQFKQLQQVTGGIDIFKDVISVTVANAGGKGGKALAIIRGNFDLDKITKTAADYARENKGELKISKLGERNLYEGMIAGQTLFSAFVDSSTAVLSPSKELVTAAADGKGGKVAKEVAAALEAVDAKQSIWIAGLVPEQARKALGQGQRGPGEALKKIKTVGGGITFTNSIAFSLTASAGDAAAVKELAKTVEGAKAALGIFLGSNEMLKPLVDELTQTLAVKTTGDTIRVSFKLSEDVIDKAAKAIPRP